MRLSVFKFPAALVLAAVLPQWTAAADIQVTQAWARPTPPTVQVGAVYFSVKNSGAKEDRLVAVSSSAAASVEIHETQTVKGMMQMRQVASVSCPAGATVKIEPGGLHVMLLGLKQPLMEGYRVDLTLRFRDAGVLSIQVPIQNGP
jgi:periplasmic copper chaperone A